MPDEKEKLEAAKRLHDGLLARAQGLCDRNLLTVAWIRQKLKSKPSSKFRVEELEKLSAELTKFEQSIQPPTDG